jgi:D-proline reductase (dithiol) PrdB
MPCRSTCDIFIFQNSLQAPYFLSFAVGAIEHRSIPSISITVRPEITAHANVSRACYVRFPTGNPVGEPNKPVQQHMILSAVLEQLVEIKEPGTIVELPFRWRRI